MSLAPARDVMMPATTMTRSNLRPSLWHGRTDSEAQLCLELAPEDMRPYFGPQFERHGFQPSPFAIAQSNLGIDFAPRGGRIGTIAGGAWAIGLCHRHHGRTQQPFTDRVTGLHDIHHRSGLGAFRGNFGNGLMQMRIEALTLRCD